MKIRTSDSASFDHRSLRKTESTDAIISQDYWA